MEIYLVGGAVRDALLGRSVTDRDWVVVGADSEQMLALGYTQVGRDFPVFLHPDSHEEYALARTERKSGPGHKGFKVHAGADVSLEEDLARRDLTINAMARTTAGQLVDPFGGAADLRQRWLRHVSDAFSEDPLRVLRVARFAAQLGGFRVAPATLALLQQITAAGGLRELPAERVAQELSKLLEKQVPVAPFFEVLAQAQALADWFPEFSEPPPAVPDALVDADLRYAALTRLLSVPAAETLAARLKVSSRRLRLSVQVCRFGESIARWPRVDADVLRAALQELGAFKDPAWLQQAPSVIAACGPVDLSPLGEAVQQVNEQVDSARLMAAGHQGPALGRALAAARSAVLATQQLAARD